MSTPLPYSEAFWGARRARGDKAAGHAKADFADRLGGSAVPMEVGRLGVGDGAKELEGYLPSAPGQEDLGGHLWAEVRRAAVQACSKAGGTSDYSLGFPTAPAWELADSDERLQIESVLLTRELVRFLVSSTCGNVCECQSEDAVVGCLDFASVTRHPLLLLFMGHADCGELREAVCTRRNGA